MKRFLMLLILLFTISSASFNVYDFQDEDKERRFNGLIKELRCPKCQNNNLADSNAPLATDIKNYVYNSIKTGKTNKEISDFLVSRYGEFILFRPRNIFIWMLPTIIGIWALLTALFIIYRNRLKPKTNHELTLPDMKTIINQYEKSHRQNGQ